MAAEDAKQAEEAKRLAEEAKRAAEAKASAERASAERANAEKSKAAETQKKQEETKATPEASLRGSRMDSTGKVAEMESKGSDTTSKVDTYSADPYGNSLYNRSFPQATPRQRNSGDFRGTSVEASELRQAGQENLRKDTDFLNRALGVGSQDMIKSKDRDNNALAKVLQEKTGVKMESTGGMGQYSDRDLGKMLATPEVRQYMNSIKTGDITPEKAPVLSVREQVDQGLKATQERLANNKSDFSRDLARYESTTKDTTKGPRLDTRSNSNIVRSQDPLQSIGSNLRVKNERAAEYGGSDPLEPTTRNLNKPGIYDPSLGTAGSLAYSKVGNVPTNKPATSVGEFNTRTAALEQDKIGNERATALRQAQASTGKLRQGVTMPNGEFLANAPKKPKIGIETDDQRIARREKEVGVGRFAGSMETRRSPSQSLSYFDDKSRGKRI